MDFVVRVVGVVAVVGFITTGCQSDKDCSFEACGGDPVGDWAISHTCLTNANAFAREICPTATGSARRFRSGTVIINADNTYTADITTTTITRLTLPAECYADAPEFTACAQLDEVFGDEITCTGDIAVSCTCDGAETRTELDQLFLWSVNGTSISILGETAEFCVAGDTLKIQVDGDANDPIETWVLERMGSP